MQVLGLEGPCEKPPPSTLLHQKRDALTIRAARASPARASHGQAPVSL